MIISQTSSFAKQKKKLHQNQIKLLDEMVKKLIDNPKLGEAKKGDLSKIRVYKFIMTNQEYLLAYQLDEERIILHSIGSHENFYRDLQRVL